MVWQNRLNPWNGMGKARDLGSRLAHAWGQFWNLLAGWQKTFLLAALISLAGYAAIPLPHPLFPADYSTMILDCHGNILRVFLNRDQQWCLAPSSLPIPQKLKTCVLYYEDRRFYQHRGVSLPALARAFWQNQKPGHRRSGASTLTMQLARMLRPKARTYGNKLLEIAQALKIEAHSSKEEILRQYLNHAPYGGNIRGYQAASWKYFGREAKDLTWAQAATLAVLPNAPSLVTPSTNPVRLLEKRNRLLQALKEKGVIEPAEFQMAASEPAPSQAQALPFIAPHATENLFAHNPGVPVIHSTLDRDLQAKIKDIVNRHATYLAKSGIKNASLLVAETGSGAVRAYLGSQAYENDAARGKVDGVLAPRSSGSLLKPFLYALALEEGLVLPDMLIKDVPTYYRDFAPENPDKAFRGMVTVREALIRSLNVPAVCLLDDYGLDRFYFFLTQAGLTTLFRKPEEYGLSLILGGGEITVWDIATLFRGLGNLGKFSPLHLRQEDAAISKAGKVLIQKGAVYETLEILKDLHRPGAEYYWELFQNQTPLAWKTGTSYGNRDAWAVGVSPEWTVAVWVGNFTGEPNQALIGGRTAGPILFDVFNLLPKKRDLWFEKPGFKSMQAADICLQTGCVASPLCPQSVERMIPKTNWPAAICPYHQKVHFTPGHKNTTCSLCWGENGHTDEVCLLFPPQVQQYLRKQGEPVTLLPPHLPSCPAYRADRVLEIIYPQENNMIWIPRGVAEQYQRFISEVSHRDNRRRVFWYLDGLYLGETCEKHEKAIFVKTGEHWLQVVDENGNRASRHFQTAMKE